MENVGSYYVRRLSTLGDDDIQKYDYSDWMGHPNVQKQRLYNLTLPGSHVSPAYGFKGEHEKLGKEMSYGIQTQRYTLAQQLRLGVRFLDVRVAWSFTEKKLFASYGLLLRPLADVLTAVREFLEQHRNEVVVLSLKKAKNVGKYNEEYVKPLLDEETSNSTIPGQMVHQAVSEALSIFLTTYQGLSTLDQSSNMANPTIQSLCAVNKRVVYFWEGQQVLCVNRDKCLVTPGWLPPTSGLQFAFGPPMPVNYRAAYSSVKANKIVEPGCIHNSWQHSRTSLAEKLMNSLHVFCTRLRESVTTKPLTECFPPLTPIPVPGEPPLFYEASAFISLTPAEQAKQQNILRGKEFVFKSGEGMKLESEAERVSFLLLTWLMKKDNEKVYMKPNVFTMDYVHPVVIERLVHTNQGRPDCGYGIYCRATGSCWAKTLLGAEDKCLIDSDVMNSLKWQAGETVYSMWWLCFVLAPLTLIASFCACACFVRCKGFKVLPAVKKDREGFNIKWLYIAKPPEEEPAAGSSPAAESSPAAGSSAGST